MSPSKFKKCFTSVNKSENKCNICFKIVKGTNTTNMKKHLMLKHPSKLAVLAQEQQPMVTVSTFQYIIN
jgi:hypothetical protein